MEDYSWSGNILQIKTIVLIIFPYLNLKQLQVIYFAMSWDFVDSDLTNVKRCMNLGQVITSLKFSFLNYINNI